MLGCSRTTVKRLVASGALIPVEISPRLLRIADEEVERFILAKTRVPAGSGVPHTRGTAREYSKGWHRA